MNYEIGELYQNKNTGKYYICLDKDGLLITRDKKKKEFKIVKTQKKKKIYLPKRDVNFEKLISIWGVSEEQLDSAVSDVFFRSSSIRDREPSYRTAQRKAFESGGESFKRFRLIKTPRML